MITYHWDFGDGTTSTEKVPEHTYLMPGTYIVTFTVTINGVESTSTRTVYVYDYDLTGNEGVHVPYSYKCYVAAVRPSQGNGIFEWGGDNFVWPEAYVGAQKGYDKGNNAITAVLNNFNGKFYQIGIPDLWEDRKGPYSQNDIVCRLRLPERVPTKGEREEVEHIESHYTMRPYSELYKNTTGYDEHGYKTGHYVNSYMYRDGEQVTPISKRYRVNMYGDVVFGERVRGKRLQNELVMTTAAWRLTKVTQKIANIDIKAGPIYDTVVESTWQREFVTPDLWVTRDRKTPTKNRATGIDMSGSYAALATGPDLKSQSAVSFSATDTLTGTIPLIDFEGSSFSLWLNTLITAGEILRFTRGTGDTLSVIIFLNGGQYDLWLTSTSGWSKVVSFAWSGFSWINAFITISSTYVKVYKNGTLFDSIALPFGGTYGGATIINNGAAVSMFDIRRHPREISASAISYYYNDVISNSGNGGVLPMVR